MAELEVTQIGSADLTEVADIGSCPDCSLPVAEAAFWCAVRPQQPWDPVCSPLDPHPVLWFRLGCGHVFRRCFWEPGQPVQYQR